MLFYKIIHELTSVKIPDEIQSDFYYPRYLGGVDFRAKTADNRGADDRWGAVDYGGFCGECDYGGFLGECDYGEWEYGGCVSVRIWPIG